MQFIRKQDKREDLSLENWISRSVLEFDSEISEIISSVRDFDTRLASKTPCLDESHLIRVNILEITKAQIGSLLSLEKSDGLENIKILKERKEYRAHARVLRETIAENIATLTASIFMRASEHISCVQFQSDKPLGQALGLFNHNYKLNECATGSDLDLYHKALRASEIESANSQGEAHFLNKYGIKPIFPNLGNSVSVSEFRSKEGLFDDLRLSERDKQILRFTLREFNRLEEMTIERGVEFIERFEKKATKSGLDAMDALDLFGAIIFTLHTLSLSGVSDAERFEPLFTLWRSLDLYSDEIRNYRHRITGQLDRRKNKELISRHLLPVNELMEILQLPHDETRGYFSQMMNGFINGTITADQIIHEFPAMKKFENELHLMKEDI